MNWSTKRFIFSLIVYFVLSYTCFYLLGIFKECSIMVFDLKSADCPD